MNNKLHTIALTTAFTLALVVNLTAVSSVLSMPLEADAIIDFDDFAASRNPAATILQAFSPFEEDGVTLTATDPISSFLVITESNDFTTGSALLLNLERDTAYTLRSSDSGFGVSLLSFDGADVFNNDTPRGVSDNLAPSTPATLTFIGVRFDGSTLAGSVTTDGGNDFLSAGGSPTTYDLPALAGEVFESIAFVNPGLGIGIDNIAVRLTLVPEPSSLALLGLASLAAARMRRRIA